MLEPGRDEHPVLAAVEPLVAQVADVGDVLDVEDLDPVVQERPPDQVGQQVAAQVADVGVAVDGRAAGVHPEALTSAGSSGSTARVSVLRRRRRHRAGHRGRVGEHALIVPDLAAVRRASPDTVVAARDLAWRRLTKGAPLVVISQRPRGNASFPRRCDMRGLIC